MEHIKGEPYRPRFIMGLESSCDETSVAIIENGKVSVKVDPENPLNKTMRLIVIADTAKLRKLR